MHTGIISFCDRIAYNIKCSDAKDIILNPLENKYQIRILQKHWVALDDMQFKYIKQIPHEVCIRSNGNPYFLYFTRYEDVSQIMYIDKKVQPGYQKPRIILTRGQFSDDIFNNTLLEGEMVKDVKNQWIFLINDVIIYKGKHLKDVELSKRLSYAYEMLEMYYTPDAIMDVCTYQVKKYVKCSKNAVEKLVLFSETLPYTSRGIYFVPVSMRYKPKLINFDDSLIKTVYRKVKDCPEFVENTLTTIDKNITIPKIIKDMRPDITEQLNDDKNRIIWLRKTDQPDIYDMYETENSYQKFNIAYVPSLITSKMLRSVFKNMNVATSVPFICKYDDTFQKWIPLKDVL